MGIIEHFKQKFLNKGENSNSLIVLNDGTQKTLGQLIFMAGQYSELRNEKNILQNRFEALMIKNNDLQNELKSIEALPTPLPKETQINIPSIDELNETEKSIIAYVASSKILKKDLVKNIMSSENIPISSRPSAFRVVKKLKESNLIRVEKGVVYANKTK